MNVTLLDHALVLYGGASGSAAASCTLVQQCRFCFDNTFQFPLMPECTALL